MRPNTLRRLGLVLLGLGGLTLAPSSARALYDDPSGDYYVIDPTTGQTVYNPGSSSWFSPPNPGSGTYQPIIDPNSDTPHIATDIQSVSGIYDPSSSSYVFTIKFYNSTIALPDSHSYANGELNTQVFGALDIALANPSAASQINQASLYFNGTDFAPLPKSNYYFNLTTTSYNPGTNTSSGYVQMSGSNIQTSMGTLAMPDSQTFVITVPLASLGLANAQNLTYTYFATNSQVDAVDYGPNGGPAYSLTVNAVPEASSLALLALGSAGLALGAWRRRLARA
jgi:hypothetical protein